MYYLYLQKCTRDKYSWTILFKRKTLKKAANNFAKKKKNVFSHKCEYRVRGKQMSQEESKYLWVTRGKFAVGRRDSDRAFQSRSLRSCGIGRPGKSGGENWEVIEAIRGETPRESTRSWRTGGNNPSAELSIAKLLRAFLCLRHPTASWMLDAIPGWTTRCDSLTTR